jgi:hypothetical protein
MELASLVVDFVKAKIRHHRAVYVMRHPAGEAEPELEPLRSVVA